MLQKLRGNFMLPALLPRFQFRVISQAYLRIGKEKEVDGRLRQANLNFNTNIGDQHHVSIRANYGAHWTGPRPQCDLKHNFAAAARLCFKNCAATLCFKLFFLDSNEPQHEITASPGQSRTARSRRMDRFYTNRGKPRQIAFVPRDIAG
jgi:hypothetical protein